MGDTVIVHEAQPFTEIFPSAEDAKAYIEAHDAEVRLLSRATRDALRDLYQRDLASRNTVSLTGGPRVKDELISALANSRFPRYREAMEVRAWYHNRDERRRVVQELSMRLIHISEELLAEVLEATSPWARDRLRRMLIEAGDE